MREREQGRRVCPGKTGWVTTSILEVWALLVTTGLRPVPLQGLPHFGQDTGKSQGKEERALEKAEGSEGSQEHLFRARGTFRSSSCRPQEGERLLQH